MTDTLSAPMASPVPTICELPADPVHVVHSARVWLPSAQGWVHTQLRHLPASVRSSVVCDRVAHLDRFPVDRLHRPSPIGRRWHGIARRLGLRRHFGPTARAVRDGAVRLLHSWSAAGGWADLLVVREHGLRHVVTFDGADLAAPARGEGEWRARYRALFASADRVLVGGPGVAAAVREMGCPSRKVTVHHPGVELDRFRFADRERRASDPLRVLIAGPFTECRGISDGLAALSRLALMREVRVTVVGDAMPDPTSGRVRQRIYEAAGRESLADRVRFLGVQHPGRLQQIALEHDVFLHPSRAAADGEDEVGLPIQLLEMAATGLPIVATRHGDTPEVVPDDAGWLVDEGDVNGLVAALEEVAAAPDGAVVRARAARAHLEREFDAAQQGATLAAIYRDILG